MRYLSLCSGIEAASNAWNPLGWEAVGFSEIEPFPCAVLEHRFPNVPNYGDMTKYKEWNDVGQFDVLVGGTPCQSFSVAGLRRGLEDPRGNLMLVYGAIADHFRPTFIVWENVPGVLSTNEGRDFKSFLDMMEYIGYVIDIDILDAQYFGVPQRRRRVFVCGRRSEDILNKRTDTSSLIIIQLLQEISRSILAVALHQSGNARQNSDSLNRLNDGLERRMRLFGLVGEKDNSRKLLENLIEVFQKRLQELKNSDVPLGGYEKELIREGQSTDSPTESHCILTEQSLSEVLGEVLKVAKSYITSTGTRIITQSEIFMFSKLVLLTGKLIVLSSRSSPSFWSAASSSLTSTREYINYARQTTSDLFGDMERLCYWSDFVGEAVQLQEFIGSIGIECFGKVFPVSESMRGDPAPSRKTGERVAGTISARTKGGGGLGTDFELGGELQVAHTLRGEGFDASEDGTGRGTPIIPVAIQAGAMRENPKSGPDGIGVQEHIAYTIEARAEVQAVCYDMRGRGDGNTVPTLCTDHPSRPSDYCPVVMANGHSHAEIGTDFSPTLTAHMKKEAPILAMHETGQGFWQEGDIAGTLRAEGENRPSRPSNVIAQAFQCSQSGATVGDTSATLRSSTGGGIHDIGILGHSTVRRLTPRECERLQGFPDDWTRIPWRGASAENCPDGPRYKACGNSMAVPVMRWIGEKIAMLEKEYGK